MRTEELTSLADARAMAMSSTLNPKVDEEFSSGYGVIDRDLPLSALGEGADQRDEATSTGNLRGSHREPGQRVGLDVTHRTHVEVHKVGSRSIQHQITVRLKSEDTVYS